MGEIVDALRRADRDESAKQPTPRDLPASGSPASSARPAPTDVAERRPPSAPAGPPSAASPSPEESTAGTTTPESPTPATPATPPKPAHEPAPEPARPARLVLNREGEPEWKAARTALFDPYGDATQQFRRLAFRIRDLADARQDRSIVVTSAQMGDGKTTTICNLAVQLARLDRAQRVVLVDLDLRRPSVAPAFGIAPPVNVDEVLSGERSLSDAVFETDVDGLWILSLKRPAVDPESLLAHPNLRAMLASLENQFDRVLIDSPPVLAVTDAQLILRYASAGLFVARAGETTVKSVRRALDLLPTKKMLGSFLNASPNSHSRSGYQYYHESPDGEAGVDPSDGPETTSATDTTDATDASDATKEMDAAHGA